MKISKIIYKITLLTMLIIICSSCVCHADFKVPNQVTIEGGGTSGGGTSGGTGGGSVGLPNLSDFKPTVSAGSAVSIIGSLLSVLMILGATMIVVAIAIIGFNTILGSASEKAEYQQKLVGVIFAGIFMVASSSIAKLIISVAVSF